MIEALTTYHKQLVKFQEQIDLLEEEMDNTVFMDSSDLAVCERLLIDHYEYLNNLQMKYQNLLDLVHEKSN